MLSKLDFFQDFILKLSFHWHLITICFKVGLCILQINKENTSDFKNQTWKSEIRARKNKFLFRTNKQAKKKKKKKSRVEKYAAYTFN